MPSEDAVTLEARLVAIEHLMTHLAKTVYLVSGFPDTLVSQAHKNVLQGLQEETFPQANINPAMKDHFAAVIRANAARLLADFERALKESRAPEVL